FSEDHFITATKDGQIVGWPGTPEDPSFLQRAAKTDALYTGLALVDVPPASSRVLLAPDFHGGTLDIYGPSYEALVFREKATGIPEDFAPFNVVPIGDQIYVTYAKQNANKTDSVPGRGNGYVSVFSFTLAPPTEKILVARGELDSPWAVALAPSSFGALAGTLLVGNFGDGAIHAYDPNSGALVGQLTTAGGDPLHIPGLWDLKAGPGGTTDLSQTLFFTAGPSNEAHGVLGKLEATPN
ncbi:MAG TPA: TIGR03118 family protein, partial [Polyangiaceae bacterium]|nr:TIGR03118 family protein [Polyangiaceae bacterium]